MRSRRARAREGRRRRRARDDRAVSVRIHRSSLTTLARRARRYIRAHGLARYRDNLKHLAFGEVCKLRGDDLSELGIRDVADRAKAMRMVKEMCRDFANASATAEAEPKDGDGGGDDGGDENDDAKMNAEMDATSETSRTMVTRTKTNRRRRRLESQRRGPSRLSESQKSEFPCVSDR